LSRNSGFSCSVLPLSSAMNGYAGNEPDVKWWITTAYTRTHPREERVSVTKASLME